MQIDLFSGNRISKKPLACDHFDEGLYRYPPEIGYKKRHVQVNPEKHQYRFLFDIDRSMGAHAWEDAQLPPPNWTATNPKNGHAHIAYEIDVPIAVNNWFAKDHPIRYAAAIQHAYTRDLGADRAYAHRICKNPLSGAWIVSDLQNKPYTLGELAEYTHLEEKTPPRKELIDLGRNVSLFNDLRSWAYQSISTFREKGWEIWNKVTRVIADTFNLFTIPLPQSEVRATARSVARWVWTHCTPEYFANKQRARGKNRWNSLHAEITRKIEYPYCKNGCEIAISDNRVVNGCVDDRDVRIALIKKFVNEQFILGIKPASIAQKLGVSTRTVYNYLKVAQ